MKIGFKSPTEIAMALLTSMAAAIGGAAGRTLWKTFGESKVAELTEKKERSKNKIGFVID